MTLALYSLGIYISGIACGVLLMRYAYGLGFKAYQSLKDDVPLGVEDMGQTEQEATE